MGTDDISKLVEFADHLVYEKTKKHLETVEKDILRQTFAGKKLLNIESESYSKSYIQRFVAPKLWARLSDITGEKVRKTTVREVLKRLQSQQSVPNSSVEPTHSPATPPITHNGQTTVNNSVSDPTLGNGSSPESESVESTLSASVNSSETDNPSSDRVENGSATALPLVFQPARPNNPEPPPPIHSNNWLRFMNFMNPGVPLLLSLGIVGSAVSLSWLANWYGVKSHLTGLLPRAEFFYSWALKLNPTSKVADYNLGRLYEDQQNMELAHAKYRKAMQDDFVAAPAYNNLARLYILDNDYTSAVDLLSKGMNLATDNEEKYALLKNLGWARLMQARYPQAKAHLQEAIALDSDKAPAHCLMAQVLEAQQDKAQALPEWETCLAYASYDNPDEDTWIGMAKKRLKTARDGQ